MFRVRKASCGYYGRIKDGCQTLSILSLRSKDGWRKEGVSRMELARFILGWTIAILIMRVIERIRGNKDG